jgi:hypothetical protein
MPAALQRRASSRLRSVSANARPHQRLICGFVGFNTWAPGRGHRSPARAANGPAIADGAGKGPVMVSKRQGPARLLGAALPI